MGKKIHTLAIGTVNDGIASYILEEKTKKKNARSMFLQFCKFKSASACHREICEWNVTQA